MARVLTAVFVAGCLALVMCQAQENAAPVAGVAASAGAPGGTSASATAAAMSPGWEGRSQYGGCLAIKGKKTGFFHTERINDRWLLVDPDGYSFLAIGMTGGSMYGAGRMRGTPTTELADRTKLMKERYPTAAEYSAAQVKRLKDWGFTALMADAMGGEKSMPYGIILNVVAGPVNTSTFRDVFSQPFERAARAAIAGRCAALKDDPYLIGYFTGNELFWGADWYGGMLDNYLALDKEITIPAGRFGGTSMPASAPAPAVAATNPTSPAAGAVAAAAFLKERYHGAIADFNRAWDVQYADFDALVGHRPAPGPKRDLVKIAADRDAFDFVVAQRFFGFLATEIRKVDPNHMIMGSRFLTGDVPLAVARGMKGNVDICSFNCYAINGWPDELFRAFSAAADAPILISEFGYSAKDSGLTMDHTGAIPRIVETQQDRADKYAWYVSHLAACPYLVGTTWWWYPDGFGGRNVGNFGFVNWKDEPYQTLANRATKANFDLYPRVVAGGEKLKTATPPEFVFTKKPQEAPGTSIDWISGYGINLDQANRYEGFDFVKSKLSAEFGVWHDAEYIHVKALVKDADVKWYTQAQLDADQIGIWEIDGIEVWLGHHHAVVRMDGKKAVVNWGEGAIEGATATGSATPDGYMLDLAVHKSELADVIKEGVIRFAVGVNDGQAHERFRQLFWPPSYEWAYLKTFAIGKLD